jgi:aspartyl-tRNA synthetase
MDRYYQVVRCFRDEDLRADRQPEFTQIDMEFSFVGEEDIISLTEGMIQTIFKAVSGIEVNPPFKHMTFDEAMQRFGTDRPDTRFGLELTDLTDTLRGCGFKVFSEAIESGGAVKAINAKGCATFSRKDLDNLTEYAGRFGARGMAWIKIKEDEWQSPITKFFSEEEINAMREALDAQPGDLILFGADQKSTVNQVLAELRLELARRLNLIARNTYEFVWITDFPLVEYDTNEKRYAALHHPFTAPKEDQLDLLDSEPEHVKSRAYDLVLNGNEIGGGSIRIHRKDVQEKVFSVLGIDQEEAREKFGFLLKALELGAPPHGGIAFGLDRLMMILAGASSIRDVIAFPKTQKATCPLTDAPASVSRKQLTELHLRPDWKEE